MFRVAFTVSGKTLFRKANQQQPKQKMKTTPIITLTALSFAILAAFAFSGCEGTGGSRSGTHQMGSPKTGYTMSDQNMPGRR